MSQTPFQGLTPTRVLWVSTAGSAKGDGSAGAPFQTVQQAVDHSTPGTAIMVKAGTYVGNTVIKASESGTASAPIWIISADGPGQAHLVAASSSSAVLGGGGVSNIVVDGFHISGGLNGIQFSQDGFTFTKTISNVVVQDNTIDGAVEDGIKANGGFHVYVLDNTISNGEGQQGVDFVAVNDSVISNNEVSHITGSAGIYVKGGSTNDVISNNYVHDVAGDGIGVGYHMGDLPFMPGYTGYEASNILVTGNEVTNAAGRAVVAVGAVNSTITGNSLATDGSHYEIAVTADHLTLGGLGYTWYSHGLTIAGNDLANSSRQISVTAGNEAGLVTHDNVVGGLFTAHVGPSAQDAQSLASFISTIDHLF